MRPVIGIAAATAFALALVVAGCSQRGAEAGAQPRAAAPDSAATRAGRGTVPRLFIMADPARTISPPAEAPPPEPTVEYATLEAVRDTLLAMVRRGTAAGDTAVHVTSAATRFEYHYLKDSAPGYAIHVVVTDTTSCPVELVEKALERAGWAPKYDYSADGPDGTTMGYVTRKYFCFVEGSWDGGDDSDTTYVPAPGCEVTVTCVPRREDDVMK